MKGERKERWQELCELAANEQYPAKLSELVDEIKKRKVGQPHVVVFHGASRKTVRTPT